MNAPRDHDWALAQYRRRAGIYDRELAVFEPLRRSAVEWLALAPGERVLDLGCGTGLSLPLLEAAIGARGHVTAIEQCPEMLAKARARARSAGWRNVAFVGAAVEDAHWRGRADAALLHFTHDIVQSEAALARLAAHLEPGARVVATGLQWAPPWLLPLNLFVFGAALHSVTSLAGLDRPWSRLRPLLDDCQLREFWGGAVYQLRGRWRAAGARH